MKKILMGLMALSTLSFAALNLGDPTSADSNIFNNTQNGRITIEGGIISTVPEVKYVVYTSANGDFDNTGDKLVLPDWYLSTKSLDSKFAETPKKIYVKRINADGNAVEELDVEKVTFNPIFDSFYTAFSNMNIASGATSMSFPSFAFIPKTTLDGIVTATGISNLKVSDAATLGIGNGQSFYREANYLAFHSPSQGVLEIQVTPNPNINKLQMSPENIKKVEAVFSSKQSFTNFIINISIK